MTMHSSQAFGQVSSLIWKVLARRSQYVHGPHPSNRQLHASIAARVVAGACRSSWLDETVTTDRQTAGQKDMLSLEARYVGLVFGS